MEFPIGSILFFKDIYEVLGHIARHDGKSLPFTRWQWLKVMEGIHEEEDFRKFRYYLVDDCLVYATLGGKVTGYESTEEFWNLTVEYITAQLNYDGR